ncbi:hypothetical protein HanIR_Chr17g0851381 [Helianthus annuus]|nr:hypothetical protein HanIR_Chr17g0851381 [Helianthus annuus]
MNQPIAESYYPVCFYLHITMRFGGCQCQMTITSSVYLFLTYSGETSGMTVTSVMIDEWTITVKSVGGSRCILDK